MNLLTFGLLVGDLKVSQFSVTSKIISDARRLFPEYEIITLKMTGREITDIYKQLEYEVQARIVDVEVMVGLEERNFYKELELHQALDEKSKNYNDTFAVNIVITITAIILLTFILVVFIYHQNTVLNNDVIKPNIIVGILHMMQYVVSHFI